MIGVNEACSTTYTLCSHTLFTLSFMLSLGGMYFAVGLILQAD